MTSSTKRLKTYKVVDDIHHRLTRQRALFRNFLEENRDESERLSRRNRGDGFPVTRDILKDPIESLMQSMKRLEEIRAGIVRRKQEVSEKLRRTQVIHAQVKVEYNSTVAHTSALYPEVS